MSIVLKPGQKEHGYEVRRELGRGAFAISYEARSALGERVFFKQYKSPTRLVDWYHGFVDHQKELKRRIESDPAARDRCYRFIEFFEDRDFYQVFEFIDGGKALTDCVAERRHFTWDQLVIFAKVMMFGVKGLHDIRIVHTDLKPDNIILIPDATIGTGYRLRLIDMDWSIFSDKRAPWHGKQGYIGTAFYQSPEHLAARVPVTASDVFTCGIMLGEILGSGHPFLDCLKDESRYAAAIKNGDFEPISLRQPIPKVEDRGFLEAILNACLDPHPDKRPTAGQVCDALIGKTFDWGRVKGRASARAAATSRLDVAAKKPPFRAASVPAIARAVELLFNGVHVTTVSTEAEFGKQNFKSLNADAQFLSDPQFRIFRRDGVWLAEHCASATNETLLDGAALVAATALNDGMRIAVGNSSKGIEKFPLQVRLIR